VRQAVAGEQQRHGGRWLGRQWARRRGAGWAGGRRRAGRITLWQEAWEAAWLEASGRRRRAMGDDQRRHFASISYEHIVVVTWRGSMGRTVGMLGGRMTVVRLGGAWQR